MEVEIEQNMIAVACDCIKHFSNQIKSNQIYLTTQKKQNKQTYEKITAKCMKKNSKTTMC